MKKDTRIVNAGRNPKANHGIVNPPVYRASTVVFPSLKALEEASSDPFNGVYYGRFGTPTTFAFEDAVAELEGGKRSIATSSGLAAITATLLAFLDAGDHLLMVDSVYAPTRRFCDQMLARLGIETTYYDPCIGSGISDLLRKNTRVVFLESPGSLSFEMQDVAAIAEAAHSVGAKVVLDNSWATPLLFRPFENGVDISIQAATKYIVGHADAMLGTITTTDEAFLPVRRSVALLGCCSSPDDCYLGLRGLRTLSVRLARHQETGLRIARWLAARPEVARILHPALEGAPGHAIWKRDFSGACGLFGVVLNETPARAVAAMLDGLELFAMGYSWGGFESLILLTQPQEVRSVTTWEAPGPTLRIHAGLEDADDLIADLDAGFRRLNAAR
jgi:cystathionine beta-lyase